MVAYGVANRTNEFGVRMALGARRMDVVRIVLSDHSLVVGLGLLAGLAASLVLDRVEARWVTESSRDFALLAGVVAALIATALVACLQPARRAASIDPMQALRYE